MIKSFLYGVKEKNIFSQNFLFLHNSVQLINAEFLTSNIWLNKGFYALTVTEKGIFFSKT